MPSLSSIVLAVVLGFPAVLIALALPELFGRYKESSTLLQNLPGIRIFIYPHSFFALLPRFPGFNIGNQYLRRYRHKLFSSRGTSDVLLLVSFFPPVRAIQIADPVAIKHIVADRMLYQKPPHIYRALNVYGPNVVVTEGDDWRRHKRIITSGFTEIVCATSFSQLPPWRDDVPEAIPTGHTLPFRVAVRGVMEYAILHTATPKWCYKLPIPLLRHIKECHHEFKVYLRGMIAERRAMAIDTREDSNGKRDLLGALLYASADLEEEEERELVGDKGRDKARARLSDEELMGNLFVFLLAGHETSANTLAYAMTLLALYPEEQKKLFEHIDEVAPEGTELNYNTMSKLTGVLAVFQETLRLFPAVVVVPKWTVENTHIPVSANPDGTPAPPVFIPQWTEILINNIALHRSPRYWGEDHDVFRPDRFIDAPDGSYRWPRDAYLAFSGGPRACLAQKFATTTSTVTIASIIRKYSVHLQEDLDGTGEKRRLAGETHMQKVERVTDSTISLALSLKSSKLIFKER
ncbi:hypothetical protein MNV49_000792 [Pseudohyphozyma bogoriensis]|nr:hypothetical protein MNV49_000792 [Pseudohyphozyma bogoriensis]